MAEKLLTERHLLSAQPEATRDRYLSDGGGL